MKLVKKLTAGMLAVGLLLSTALTGSATETTDPTEPLENLEAMDSSISDLMNVANINPLSGEETEPFNAAPGATIQMMKENELMLYSSNTGLYNTDLNTFEEKIDAEKSYSVTSGTAPELGLSFVTAVALDATGNGTDDHVAYLGVKDAKTLRLVLYNVRKNSLVGTLDLGDVSSWINDVDHWAYKHFVSVTAGDYDDDGIDEIACTDHNMGVQMVEIDYQKGFMPSMVISKRYDWSQLMKNPQDSSIAASGVNRRAVICLTTGNFDGTGAEELATAVSTHHPGSSHLPKNVEAYTTHVSVLRNPLTDVSIATSPIHYTEKGDDEEEQDHTFHNILYVGQIASGDLDGDRRDEVAVAGYTGVIELDGDGDFEDGRYEWKFASFSLCYVELDGNVVSTSEITVDEMTPFIKEGFFDGEHLLVPPSIDAAKLHGQYGKESIFVGGNVYQFADGKATMLYTHPFFNEESSFVYTDAYVEHVTSGVFGSTDPLTGNPMINEQFVFTVVEKDNSQNEYNYKIGFISMSSDQETNATAFHDNAAKMKSDGYLLDERKGGALKGYGTALVPVAVDIDDDGMLVKHTDTTYFYEDPSVEAVLQASPYFGTLGGWNDFGGTTTYSATVSRSLIDLWGYTHSIHVGAKGKLEDDNIGELEVKVGYALDMDFEHELAYTTSYTTTFTAGPYDTVVVQRTPYVCYEYSFVDLGGNLLTGEDAGSVVFMEAMQPVYFQLSVDEYNQFVDEYNAMADRHDKEGKNAAGEDVKNTGDSYRLVKITEEVLPFDATGDPDKYYSALRGGEYISQGTYALGTNGGYTSSEFSYEVEQSYSATYAHGLHFEAEGVVMVGKHVGVGAFVALSFQETCGSGNASMNATLTGGEVANINPENYSAAERKTLNKYGFNWRSALWKKSLMVNPDGTPYCDSEGNELLVPVVGYVVTNVRSPKAAPTDLDAYLTNNGNQVTLAWTSSPDDSGSLLGYYVYRYCDSQDPIQVNSTILSSTASSFVDTTVLKCGKIYTYYVVACYDNGTAKYLTMNSKSSSVVWGIPLSAEEGSKYAGSMFGNGSFGMVMAMGAFGLAAAALGITLAGKKKGTSERAETEE